MAEAQHPVQQPPQQPVQAAVPPAPAPSKPEKPEKPKKTPEEAVLGAKATMFIALAFLGFAAAAYFAGETLLAVGGLVTSIFSFVRGTPS